MKVDIVLKTKGRSVETIRCDQSILMAIHKLSSLGIGALIVSDDGHRVQGMIAERDIVRGLSKHGAKLLDLAVSDVMSKSFPVCSVDDTLKQVMEQMTRTRNRHVPVIEEGQLRGLVSIGDVVKHLVDEVELESRVLRDYVGGRLSRSEGRS
ncbi:MAG TPA: CBS domain-containing protein [Acidimicrobiales bacterium]|nr:CBS domain-containing protein [Acidimicrobiales bacterium]